MITKAQIAEARKLASKTSQTRVVFKLDYCTALVLPYKAGMKLIEALEEAEFFKPNSYSAPHGIYPLKRESLDIEFMSQQEYELNKMANLLDIPLKDLEIAMSEHEPCQA